MYMDGVYSNRCQKRRMVMPIGSRLPPLLPLIAGPEQESEPDNRFCAHATLRVLKAC